MTFTIGLAQTQHPADGDVTAMVERWAQKAAGAGVDLLVFPESLMSRYEEEQERFVNEAQPLDGPFASAIDAIAARYGLWIVYTVNELNPDGSLPFNTAVITDSSGTRRSAYRKVHLFDSHTTQESSRMSAGSLLAQPVEAPFCTIGLAICYDLRFPEVACQAALAGCTLMIYPSAWVAGNGKRLQWETLLAARAIENGMFVAGVSRSDDGYIGASLLAAPDGSIVAQAGGTGTEELLVCTVDPSAVEEMRAKIPSLQHRRPDVY